MTISNYVCMYILDLYCWLKYDSVCIYVDPMGNWHSPRALGYSRVAIDLER